MEHERLGIVGYTTQERAKKTLLSSTIMLICYFLPFANELPSWTYWCSRNQVNFVQKKLHNIPLKSVCLMLKHVTGI